MFSRVLTLIRVACYYYYPSSLRMFLFCYAFLFLSFEFPDHFRVTYLGQVVDVWQYVYFFQSIEQAEGVFSSCMGDQAFFIIYIPEDDRVGRAGLLAGSPYILHIFQGTVFFFRFQLAFLQTLNTESTFFHYPSGANRYVRIKHHTGQVIIHLEYGRIQLTYCRLVLVVREAVRSRVISPVEAAYLERTVVRAITGTDTTVVCHLVETFTAVVGG